MPIRFSTFNCENLFSRPQVMNLETWEDGRDVLTDIQQLNSLIAQDVYTDDIKAKLAALLEKYEFDNENKRDDERPFSINRVRGKFFSVNDAGEIVITADGRMDWVGWVELTRERFSAIQVLNTGRVIEAVNADIQLLIEVENRTTMAYFNRQVLDETLGRPPYPYNLLVDGNDPRGIDIGLLSRFNIRSVRSHINEGTIDSPLFSRDCPEFEVDLENGQTLWVLGNHFKSKGFGSQSSSNAKRKAQAKRVAKIYEAVPGGADKLVIVAGDFNDFPGSAPLDPLLANTGLKDVMTHASYSGLPGTFDTCTQPEQKIDYILLSPALWDCVKAVGVERSGIWAPRAFKKAGIAIMPTVTSDQNSASDHGAVWVDLDL